MMINYFADILFRHQRKLEIIAIALFCFAVGSQTKWLCTDHVYTASVLVIIFVVIGLIWVQIEKIKTTKLIRLIRDGKSKVEDNRKILLAKLTTRQREIFSLIQLGKSNKEIMNELSIELSTLKTHINNIYRILEIGNRKELKSLKIED